MMTSRRLVGIGLGMLGVFAPRVGRAEAPAAVVAPAADAEDDTVATDRPDFSNGGGTLPAGVAQLEVGIEWRPSTRFALQGGVRVGLPGPIELRLEGEQYVREQASGAGSTSGFGDLQLGAKIRIRKPADWVPGFAVQPFVKLPTAGADLGSGRVDLGAAVIISEALPLDASVDVNVWTTFEHQADGSFDPSFIASASFGHAITDAIGGFVEPAIVLPAASADPAELYFGGGAIWVVHKRLALDAVAYLVDVSGDVSLMLRTGFTIRAF